MQVAIGEEDCQVRHADIRRSRAASDVMDRAPSRLSRISTSSARIIPYSIRTAASGEDFPKGRAETPALPTDILLESMLTDAALQGSAKHEAGSPRQV